MSTSVVLGSAVVGILVGLTGAGGGALMTPMLILLFSVKPSAAISSDLVAAVVMRPVGAAVHFQRGTINLRLVGWLTAGSLPAGFAGAYLLHLLGHGSSSTHDIEIALGSALLVGAAAMLLRGALDRHFRRARDGELENIKLRPITTILIGMIGGLVVGTTSVGAGSLIVVLLLFAYPMLSAKQLVGTDLCQAIPLTASAALGALVFGHIELPLTLSLVAGSVPGVLIGSLLSSRVADRLIRPAITIVVFASGLKYVGVDNTVLGWSLLAMLIALSSREIARSRGWAGRKGVALDRVLDPEC